MLIYQMEMALIYEVGGADYVTKPFSLAVLGKKIAVVFQNIEEKTNNSIIYDDGWLKINFSNNTVKIKDETIELTPKEYNSFCFRSYIQIKKEL